MNTRLNIFNAYVTQDTRMASAYDEDGWYEYAEVTAYVAVYAADGAHYALDASARLVGTHRDEEVKQYLEGLAARVSEAGSIDPELWSFLRWSYGSEQAEDQERSHELREAHEAGEDPYKGR